MFTLFLKSAAQLGLQDWRWRSDEMERLKVEVIDVSEISLMYVRNIIDVCQKYHWCVMEILLMIVWNSIDVCLKLYWCVFEVLLTGTKVCNISDGHIAIWPRNLFEEAHIDNATLFSDIQTDRKILGCWMWQKCQHVWCKYHWPVIETSILWCM